MIFWNSHPGVDKIYFHKGIIQESEGANRKLPVANRVHGIPCIGDHIEKNLVKLVFVGHDPGEIFAKVLGQLDIMVFELFLNHHQGIFNRFVDIDLSLLCFGLSGKHPNIVGDLRHTIDLGDDLLNVLVLTALRIEPLERPLCKNADGEQWLVQFMSDTRPQLPHPHHLRRLDQFSLGFLQLQVGRL